MLGNIIKDWLDYLVTVKPEKDTQGIITVTIIASVMIVTVIGMYIGLKKCMRFGQQIGHSVISFNIILFAVPIFLYLFLGGFFGIEISATALIITTIVCWGIAVLSDIIICRSNILYIIGYILIQFLFGFLLATIVGAIIASVILFGAVAAVGTCEHTSYYNITLAPLGEGVFAPSEHIIRARIDDDREGFLKGENGETFQHMSGNQYMLLFSPNSNITFDIYTIV